MGKTKNYEDWLFQVALEGEQNVLDLYNSVNNFEREGIFYTSKEVTNDGYQYLVKADGVEDALFLESDEAKFAFLDHVKTNYTDAGENDIDKWYDLKKELGHTD